MKELLYNRFWTTIQGFLYVTLQDKIYHDSCVKWYVEQSTNRIGRSYECRVLGWKCSIMYFAGCDENNYMEHFYQDSDEEFEEEYRWEVDCIKPYGIHVYLYDPSGDYIEVELTTDQLPSTVDRKSILAQLQAKDGDKVRDHLRSFPLIIIN